MLTVDNSIRASRWGIRARILVTLLYEMIKQDLQFGLATLCIGGRNGHESHSRKGLVGFNF